MDHGLTVYIASCPVILCTWFGDVCYRGGPLHTMPSDEEVRVIKTNKMYSAPVTHDDVRPARYSPVFTQQQQPPAVTKFIKPREESPAYPGPQPRQSVPPRRPAGKPQDIPVVAKPPDFDDEFIAPGKSAQQRSSPAGLHNGPGRPYQNGFGYDDEPDTGNY